MNPRPFQPEEPKMEEAYVEKANKVESKPLSY